MNKHKRENRSILVILFLDRDNGNIRITHLSPLFHGSHQEKQHRHKITVTSGEVCVGKVKEGGQMGMDVTSKFIAKLSRRGRAQSLKLTSEPPAPPAPNARGALGPSCLPAGHWQGKSKAKPKIEKWPNIEKGYRKRSHSRPLKYFVQPNFFSNCRLWLLSVGVGHTRQP